MPCLPRSICGRSFGHPPLRRRPAIVLPLSGAVISMPFSAARLAAYRISRALTRAIA